MVDDRIEHGAKRCVIADGAKTLETLAQAGIPSINLTPDSSVTVLPGGSEIDGVIICTKTDNSTGAVASAFLQFSRIRATPTDRSLDRAVSL